MAFALTPEEEKDQKIAAGVSIVLHALILLLLFYLLAWRAPDPPLPEGGIEINFGLSAVGSGDVQSQAAPNVSKTTEDARPAATQPDPIPEPEVAKVTASTPPTPVETTPKVVTTTADAPVSVKEVEKPQPKPVPQPKEVVKKEETKPVEEVKPQPEKRAMYPGKPTEDTGAGKAGTADKAAGNNNGDDANAVGDKGDPSGSLNSKAMMGKGGSGGGNLDLAGWGWGTQPRPRDTSSETGTIRIKIVINGSGTVESATVVESTVSRQVANLYRDEVFKRATFVRQGSGGTGGATGFITYTIRTN